jgi:hypothetical protein
MSVAFIRRLTDPACDVSPSLSLPLSLSLSLSLSLRASPASISPRVYERFLGAASWDFGP